MCAGVNEVTFLGELSEHLSYDEFGDEYDVIDIQSVIDIFKKIAEHLTLHPKMFTLNVIFSMKNTIKDRDLGFRVSTSRSEDAENTIKILFEVVKIAFTNSKFPFILTESIFDTYDENYFGQKLCGYLEELITDHLLYGCYYDEELELYDDYDENAYDGVDLLDEDNGFNYIDDF